METNSLFTPEISVYYRSRRWPKGFKSLIVERTQAQTGDPYLQFVTFADNLRSFDGEDQLQIAMMVKEFMEKVRKMGVPIYTQVMEGDGRAETTGVRVGHRG